MFDSNYGGDLDRRSSISSYIFTSCVGGISWKTSLQFIVALCTTEVEYVAATEGVKKAKWLRGLIIELGVAQGTTVLLLDSLSAIHLSKNDAYHSKTKHSQVSFYSRYYCTKGNCCEEISHAG